MIKITNSENEKVESSHMNINNSWFRRTREKTFKNKIKDEQNESEKYGSWSKKRNTLSKQNGNKSEQRFVTVTNGNENWRHIN